MNRLPCLWIALVLLCFVGCRSAESPFPPSDPPQPPLVTPFDSDQAKALQKAWADYLGIPVQITNSLGMKFNLIPPGEFTMGSPKSERAHENPGWISRRERRKRWRRFDDEYQRLVRITKPFYLGVHEVTQEQYEQVMGNNPSCFSESGVYYLDWSVRILDNIGSSKGKNRVSGMGPNRVSGDTTQFPVEQVIWKDAVAFCGKLSEREGGGYRLPTEAEWEYACRAGTMTAYSFGDTSSHLDRTGWFADNSGKTVIDSERIWDTDKYNYHARIRDNSCRAHVVGRKSPNAWGLYDMHGNVREWCQDRLVRKGRVKSPQAVGYHVSRGGSFDTFPTHVRAASRLTNLPDCRNHVFGFRLARTIPLSP